MIHRKSQESERAEAAAWVTRLKDAHTAADRQAFEQWLAKDAAHQRAYDQASASYDASGVLRTSKIGRQRDLDSVSVKRKLGFGRSFAAASIAVILIIGVYGLSGALKSFRPIAIETVMLSTSADGRTVTLVDGSQVSMAPASEVRIDLNRSMRIAEIRKGDVRITIAKDKRPFRIVAGKHSAEASAGTFEAQMVGGEGLLSQADARPLATKPATARSSGKAEGSAGSLAPQTLEFNAEPLGRAVEHIDEFSSGPRLDLDRNLADLRVTGVFRQGDSKAIARSLAAAFDLKLVTSPSGRLLLTR